MKHILGIFLVLTLFLSPFLLLYILNGIIVYLLNSETIGNIAIFIIITAIVNFITYEIYSFSYQKYKEETLNLLIYIPVSFISLIVTKKYLFPINISLKTILILIIVNSIFVFVMNKLIEKYSE